MGDLWLFDNEINGVWFQSRICTMGRGLVRWKWLVPNKTSPLSAGALCNYWSMSVAHDSQHPPRCLTPRSTDCFTGSSGWGNGPDFSQKSMRVFSLLVFLCPHWWPHASVVNTQISWGLLPPGLHLSPFAWLGAHRQAHSWQVVASVFPG